MYFVSAITSRMTSEHVLHERASTSTRAQNIRRRLKIPEVQIVQNARDSCSMGHLNIKIPFMTYMYRPVRRLSCFSDLWAVAPSKYTNLKQFCSNAPKTRAKLEIFAIFFSRQNMVYISRLVLLGAQTHKKAL